MTTTFAAGSTYYVLDRLFPQANLNSGGAWKKPKGVWEPACILPLGDRLSFDTERDKNAAIGPTAVLQVVERDV